MPRGTRIVTTKTKRAVTNSLAGSSYIFANEFQIASQTNPYIGLDMLCKSRKFKSGEGRHEVPIEHDTAKLFERLITLCPIKENCSIERIRIQETGLNVVGNTRFRYTKVDEGYVRFVINLRPDRIDTSEEGIVVSRVSGGTSVFIGICNKEAIVPVEIKRPVATVISEALSDFIIDSGSEVVGRHRSIAKSIFIIMDAKIDAKGVFIMASNMAGQDATARKKIQEGLIQLLKMKEDIKKATGEGKGEGREEEGREEEGREEEEGEGNGSNFAKPATKAKTKTKADTMRDVFKKFSTGLNPSSSASPSSALPTSTPASTTASPVLNSNNANNTNDESVSRDTDGEGEGNGDLVANPAFEEMMKKTAPSQLAAYDF